LGFPPGPPSSHQYKNVLLGRNLDKILDRYFYKQKQEQCDNHAREIFLQVCEVYYPEKIVGLKDFKINEVSRHKLDKLIESSPELGFWSDNFVYAEYEVPNPSYDVANEKKAKLKLILRKEWNLFLSLCLKYKNVIISKRNLFLLKVS
jgi:hypothetical protein